MYGRFTITTLYSVSTVELRSVHEGKAPDPPLVPAGESGFETHEAYVDLVPGMDVDDEVRRIFEEHGIEEYYFNS